MVADNSQHAPSPQHVVLVSRELATQYAELLAGLSGAIQTQWAWPSPEAGFALFALHDGTPGAPLPPLGAWPADDRLVHSPSLAAAGYAFACGLANEQKSHWLSGLERLRGREAFPSDRQSFAFRPVELLGITAGISQQAGDTGVIAWMSSILSRTRKEHASDAWSRALQYAAERLINVQGGRFPTIDDCERLEEIALLRWLTRRFGLSVDGRELARSILERSALEPLGNVDLPRAAVIYRGIRETVREAIASDVEQHWQVDRETRDAEALVVLLCRRFPLFAEQIKHRHDKRATVDIGDEYDVQDALHAVLRLHFDDVRPEEVTPSIAGNSGRMDFLLKTERIVVEAKMTRKGLDQRKVGDELIIDMRRYRAHPDVRTLICLVYDPDGYCMSPAALENDLSTGQDGLRTVVVVCPKGL